ncbi:hypothetical protein ES319_A11G209700v1 [Gossypium barbadense]|uniref:WRKY domain-containing protein n=3 Tax=Gossypium TaxID=3633 RepID=A0A5J5TVS2_GOSBA|nr:hypothetical protein ES319_A11G209700v1 [Gossypium barbadense]TYG94911.1 hypothetical protein ES288_A11G225700v1 [Gossypium darwinii]
MDFSPNGHSNPKPNSIFFPENPDPMADFEISDYLILDAGVFEDDTSEKGMGVANESETSGASATPEHSNMQKKKNKLGLGHRIAFRMKSEIEAVDDEYKWRKYGKKSVKNSPNPRNYYKCVSGGCNVKKRIERDRDYKSYVITTYEGVHNHESPYTSYCNQMPLMAPNACISQPSPLSSSSSSWNQNIKNKLLIYTLILSH